MTHNNAFDETHEPAATGLTLPTLTPDPVRAARVRAHCRAHLVRQQEQLARSSGRTTFARVLAPVLAWAFCVVYVAVLVTTTLRLYGAIR